MDDVVDRLRNWDDQQPPFRVMLEAADEIERLRKVITEYVVVEHDHRDAWNMQTEPTTSIGVLREKEQSLFDEAYRIIEGASNGTRYP